MSRHKAQSFVLSFYPSTRGYAFAVFEGQGELFDWGLKEIRAPEKNEQTLAGTRALIDKYRPARIVIENYTEQSSRRSERIKELYAQIERLAEGKQVKVWHISRKMLLECFADSGAETKYTIAQEVARKIPALAHRLPPKRQIWMSESPLQALFDALALGMAFYEPIS